MIDEFEALCTNKFCVAQCRREISVVICIPIDSIVIALERQTVDVSSGLLDVQRWLRQRFVVDVGVHEIEPPALGSQGQATVIDKHSRKGRVNVCN